MRRIRPGWNKEEGITECFKVGVTECVREGESVVRTHNSVCLTCVKGGVGERVKPGQEKGDSC